MMYLHNRRFCGHWLLVSFDCLGQQWSSSSMGKSCSFCYGINLHLNEIRSIVFPSWYLGVRRPTLALGCCRICVPSTSWLPSQKCSWLDIRQCPFLHLSCLHLLCYIIPKLLVLWSDQNSSSGKLHTMPYWRINLNLFVNHHLTLCDTWHTQVHTVIIIIVGFVALHLVDYSQRKDWVYAATTSWLVFIFYTWRPLNISFRFVLIGILFACTCY